MPFSICSFQMISRVISGATIRYFSSASVPRVAVVGSGPAGGFFGSFWALFMIFCYFIVFSGISFNFSVGTCSGLFTSSSLLRKTPNCVIDVFDAAPVPFGLVRYGVAPDHQEVWFWRKYTVGLQYPNMLHYGLSSPVSPVVCFFLLFCRSI